MDLLLEVPFVSGLETVAGRFGAPSISVYGSDILYFQGCLDEKTSSSQIIALDLVSLSISAVKYTGESPGAISGHAVVRGNGKFSDQVFLVGGVGSSGEPSGAIFQYSLPNKSWKKLKYDGEGPPGLTGHEIQFFNGQIFVFGGFTYSKDTKPHSKQLSNDMWCYQVDLNRWRKLSLVGGDKISPRSGHSTILYPGTKKMFIFGGITAQGASNEFFSINLETLEVQQIRPVGNTPSPNPRFYASFNALSADIFILFGGTDGQAWYGNEGIWLLNVEGPFWYPQTLRYALGASPLFLAAHSADIVGDSLLLYGGLTPASSEETVVSASGLSKPADVASAIAKPLVASKAIHAIQIVGRPKSDLFPVIAPKVSYSERTDTMIAKLQEFNRSVAQSEEAELISAVLTEKDIQCIKAGVDCVVLNQQMKASGQGLSQVSEALAAELASIIQLKLLLWPPEMVLPVLDAIRQLILLEQVAQKLSDAFSATNGENNFVTMCIAAAFIGDSPKSAPRIFALRCVANCFQHRCLYPLLAEDGEQILQLLESCGSSTDERERQAYADVLMNYSIILRWRLGDPLKNEWINQIVTCIVEEYEQSESVFQTLLLAFGSAVVRTDSAIPRMVNIREVLSNIMNSTDSPKNKSLLLDTLLCMDRYD